MLRNPNCDLCSFGVHSPRPPINVCIMPARPKPHDVMVVAQMPGGEDDKRGGVFSDKLLTTLKKVMDEAGIDAYYTYAVKCRKPEPKAKVNASSHVKVCSTAYLHKEIEIVKPKHIIVMGGDAMYGASKDKGIGSKQGQRFWSKNADAWIYPTYHNATCLYDPDKRKAMWNELRMFIRMINGENVTFEPPLKIVRTLKGLRILQKKIREYGGKAAVDIETNMLDMFVDGGQVRCIQFCFDEEYGGVFVPLGLADEEDCFNGVQEVTKMVLKGRGKVKTEVPVTVLEPIPAERFWQDGETLAQAVEILREILLETQCAWHNGKFDRKWLHMWGKRRFGKPIECPKIWMDTQHVAHVINENRASFKLKKLIIEEFGFPSYDIPNKLTKDLSTLIPYSTNDTVATLMLAKKYSATLKEPDMAKIRNLYFKVIRPMDRIYTEIELEGWPVDGNIALQKKATLIKVIQKTIGEMDAYLTARNIDIEEDENDGVELDGKLRVPKRYSSSDKLAVILFEELGLPMSPNPKLAKTDDGKPSTDVDALLHIRTTEFIKLLFKLKKAVKALSTYVLPMIQQSLKYGKIITSYKLAGPVTGRTASGKEEKNSAKGDSMNLQNIPYIYGIKEIVAPGVNPITGEDQVIIDVDHSQIEFRGAAEESRDTLMLWAYANDVDLHTYRAVRSLGLDKELLEGGLDIDNWHKVLTIGDWSKLSEAAQKQARKRAKPVGFGYLYGMGSATFVVYAAKGYDIDLTENEAKASRDLYFTDHAGLPKWYERVEAKAIKYGYVESLSGRRRHLPAMKAGRPKYDAAKDVKAAFGEARRQAINSPIQGFGSDLKLMSIVGIRKRLKKMGYYGVRCMLIGEVHDSILCRCDASIAVEVMHMMIDVMRHPPLLDELGIKLTVPIEAEGAIGPNYGSVKEFADLQKASKASGIDINRPLELYIWMKEEEERKRAEDALAKTKVAA